MITHRKYFSILTMMAVLLFMFMFTQVIKENSGEYMVNSFMGAERLSGKDRWEPQEGPAGEVGVPAAKSGEGIVLLGREDSELGKITAQWCLYTKRELQTARGVEELLGAEAPPEMLLLDPQMIDFSQDTEALLELAERGVDMVFCKLPDVSVVRRDAGLRKLLGIQYVRADRVKTEGVHLFGGFLLGGSYMYIVSREEDEKRQDLELEIPWYVTLSGTKTYMVGMLDEMLEGQEDKNEYFPGIIWRNSLGDAQIFAVNGDYMWDLTGIGLLSAMSYELKPYDIYPVVNAQNLLLTDFPNFSAENPEEMNIVYSRTAQAVQQDIVWPAMMTLSRRSGWKLTALLTPQWDYQDEVEPTTGQYKFYLQQLKEAEAEAGVSLRHSGSVGLEEKTARDNAFYREVGNAYTFGAACGDPDEWQGLAGQDYLENIRTIACGPGGDTPVLFYIDDSVTGQTIISDARAHTYSENIRLRSLETALGYSNVQVDIHDVLWPETNDDHWQNLIEKVSSNIDTWWKPFSAFEKTALTESDSRVRTLLNLDYSHKREGGRVILETEGMEGEGWFLLRTHGEAVAEVQGGEFQRVEEDAYLIRAQESRVELRLEKSRGVLKYTMPEREGWGS